MSVNRKEHQCEMLLLEEERDDQDLLHPVSSKTLVLSVEGFVRCAYRSFSFYLMSRIYVPDAVMLVRKDASKECSSPIIYIGRNSSAHWPFISFK